MSTFLNTIFLAKQPLGDYIHLQGFRKNCQARRINRVGLALSGFFAVQRIEAKWMSHFPKLQASRVKWIPVGVAIVNGILVNAAEKHLATSHSDGFTEKVCRAVVMAGKNIEGNMSNILDVAVFVSYVAMWCLGFTEAAFIGLAGIALILAERSGLLPEFLEKAIIPMSNIIGFSILLKTPLASIYILIVSIYLLEKLTQATSLAPKSLQNLTEGAFRIDEDKTPEKINCKEFPSSFIVNLTSIHASYDKEGNDIRSLIFCKLAEFRNEILEHLLREGFKDKSLQEEDQLQFKDLLHLALWHRYHTLRGDERHENNGGGILWKMVQQAVIADPCHFNKIEGYWMKLHVMNHKIPLSFSKVDDLLMGMDQLYTPLMILDLKGLKLPQDIIENWLNEAAPRLERFKLKNADHTYNEKFFEGGNLTELGLKLLLWDLGGFYTS